MAHSVITHKGKEVLFFNHRGLSGDEFLKSFIEATKYIIDKKKECIVVSDFTDSILSNDLSDYIKSDESKEASTYIKKQAIVGISGIKKMVLGIWNKLTGVNSKLFNTLEDAMEFIVIDK